MNKPTSALRAPRPRPLARSCFITTLAAAALAACGGGGGGGSTPTPQPITGTAAAGAPVVGTVTVKDSTGASKTSTIAADGSYSVNVAGMTGPFVFIADGTVGGRTIQMISAATNADINKTINITPFTDLIVANMAGEAASSFYASPTFAKLTAAELDVARQNLTTRLLPILNALGVEAGFDLLRSSFAADHTRFDAVMDVVRVSTDVLAQTATITDLVNHTQIQDDLTRQTDVTVMPAPPLASLTDTVANLRGVEETLAKFSAAFASGLPASDNAALRALMYADFLDWGGDVDGFLSTAGVLVQRMVGVKQSGASIVAVSDNGATLDVEFSSVQKTSEAQGNTTNQWHHQFRRNAQGLWQYAGNRRWLFTETTAQQARFQAPDNHWDYAPNIAFWAETRNSKATYAVLTGAGIKSWAPASFPGTAPAGLVLGRAGSAFKMPTTVGARLEGTWLPDCARNDTYWVSCFDLTGVLAGAVYTFTMLDDKGVVIGSPSTATLAAKPNTVAEMTAAGDAWFPRLASSDPATKAGLVNGKHISFTLTPPTDPNYKLWQASLNTPSTYQEGTAVGTTVDIGVWSGAAPTEATAVTSSRNATFTRRFSTFQPIN